MQSAVKRTVYVPQYTNTAHSQGRPLHSSPEPYIPPNNENQQDLKKDEFDKFNTDVSQSFANSASNSYLIANKTSTSSICTILLTIFGGIVLLGAVAAIVVSVLLNVNGASSNCSVIDSITLTTTAATTTINNGTTTIVSTTVATTGSTTNIGTTGSTTVAPTCSNFTVSVNWNYPGSDLVNVLPMDISICCAWCLSLGSSCAGYVYTVSAFRCWIKSSIIGSGSAAANTISAVR